MIRRALLLLLALAVVGATAACGGGDGDEKAKADSTDREEGEIGDAAAVPNSTGAPGEDTAGSAKDSATEPDDGTPSVVTAAPIPEYTGTGSAEFCAQMSSLQGSMEGTDPADVDYAALADELAAIAPPPELTTDWGLFIETQKLISSDPTGAAMENLDQAQLTAYGQASSNVSAYLADICGL
jgi:hypothetical protein